MRPATRAIPFGFSTIRPIAPSSWGSGMSSRVHRRRCSVKSSIFERWHRTYSGAMHCWPQLRVRPHTHCLAARERSAVGVTNTGFFPPSSSATGVSFSAAHLATMEPTRDDPVKKISRTSRAAAPVSRPLRRWDLGPTTDTTLGSIYLAKRSERRREEAGTSGEGLSTTLFPAATAPAATPAVSAKGKLNGPTTRTTP